MEKDVALGLLGAILTVAGLLLVFCGFLFSKAESFETLRGDKFRLLAKLGVFPLAVSFFSAFICTASVAGNSWATVHGVGIFFLALASAAIYSIIALLSL